MEAHRVLAAALVLAACSSAPSTVVAPSVPTLDRPGSGELRTLGVGAIAEQGLQPASLRELLTDAGFEAAAERTWSDRTSDVWTVTVRVVRFGNAEGAGRFEEWLAAHGAELIGGGTAADPLGPMQALVRRHEPDACCPNDTTWYLSAWREGSAVWLVFVGGPGADRSAVSDVLEEVA